MSGAYDVVRAFEAEMHLHGAEASADRVGFRDAAQAAQRVSTASIGP